MSTLSKAVGVDIGEYLGMLYNDFGLQGKQDMRDIFHYTIEVNAIKSEDVKTKRYYTSGFNGASSTKINAAVTHFLATINFLHYILPCFVKTSTDTTLKIKYINLYHISSSLRQLRTTFDTTLSIASKSYLDRIINDADLNFITSQSQFRNIVVHYGIRNFSESQIDRNLRFYGLVEHFYPGHSFETLDILLDNQIKRLSNILEEWKDQEK